MSTFLENIPRTEWYPCSVKPVRNGWYEVNMYSGWVREALFNNGEWIFWIMDGWGVVPAVGIDQPGFSVYDEWRGVSKQGSAE